MQAFHKRDSRPSVAAIVPAYNEEKTIADVVQILSASPLIDEVIVVSDGSTDQTALMAQRAGARVITHKEQNGKGQALIIGVEETQAPILVFFDADLRGLTQEHVACLILPVLSGARSMNVGLRDRGVFLTRLTRHLPLISGERALKRCVFDQIPQEYLQGFMIEQTLNYYCRIKHLRYGSVLLTGLSIRRKYEKVGWPRALWEYKKMFSEIIKAMILVRLARLTGQFKSKK